MSDFADFAAAPNPVPEAAPDAHTLTGARPEVTGVPWTKWYNVHERHSISEFKAEGLIIVVMAVIFVFHIIGAKANRAKGKAWLRAHTATLKDEFAQVGFYKAANPETQDPDTYLREKSLYEFSTYATGRQNVAFLDVNLTLAKRFNPILNVTETILGIFSDLFGSPEDIAEAVLYPFDGKESLTVPVRRGAAAEDTIKDQKSTFDNFVWAVVNKSAMQKLRDDRYDVSLTATKEHSKLPNWLAVMSESAEVTNTLLTDELAEIITAVGDNFDYLVVSDQPSDQPLTLNETVPRKRIFLKYHLPSDNNYDKLAPLFEYFVRLPDQLVRDAHFRPEVLKKVRAVRDAKIAQIKRVIDEENAEERAAEKEKAKKAKRDADLKGLDAKAQKKYLDKEREKELRKAQKKQTMRG